MQTLAAALLALALSLTAQQQQPVVPQLPDSVIHDRDIEFRTSGAG
jgi:hypothetical protein